MQISDELSKVMEFYGTKGMGGRVGFGQRPAVLVVDFVLGFTDEKCPLGANLKKELESCLLILREARRAKLPIIFTTAGYEPHLKDAGIWSKKTPSALLVLGSKWMEVDPILERQPDEPLVIKKFASGFFGTNLINLLTTQGVDTLIVTGATTSGCVRATVVDALQYGFRAIVPKEAVGDRASLPHYVNLLDMDAKYADVVSVDEVLEYLKKF